MILARNSPPLTTKGEERPTTKERNKLMLVKLLKFNTQNFHITVEDVDTGIKYDLTCPMFIFQRVQKWGPGTIMEVDVFDDVVKSVVRRNPPQGAYA